MGHDILKNEPEITEILTLFTHWHHDHIIGLFHSPVLFIKKYKMRLIGPYDNGVGPLQMMENMMRPPYFPINIQEVRGDFKYKDIKFPGKDVILIHKLGIKIIDADVFETLSENLNELISIKKNKVPLKEFLAIKTIKTYHPGMTLSYRIEDLETRKVCVLMTDHENQDSIPNAMKHHIHGADLLIIDCQYSRKRYDASNAGYGHSTPDYVINLASKCKVKRVGLTHHDPHNTDKEIDLILEEAQQLCKNTEIEAFSCSDYMDILI
ncbi:MAG: hypothetical protein IPO21_05430 [Bacteroidales bacterium]|nr:hypothetical protein [Bacteroidales bacterium]